MASTLRAAMFDQPRRSTETDERHLLSESIAPSETSSIITDIHDGERTPRAHSPARPSGARHQSIAVPQGSSQQGSYRGFASEEAYLNALRAWADGRKYAEPTKTTLVGFYGSTTMSEYADRPAAFQPIDIKGKWKAMKANRQERQKKNLERRATVV